MGNASYHFEDIESHPGVPLQVHLEGVGNTAAQFSGEVTLNLPFPQEILTEVARLAGLYHDLGKATPFFQEYLHEKDPERKELLRGRKETHHSLLSAVATYFAVQSYLEAQFIPEEWKEFLIAAAFIAVKRHHGNLESFPDDVRLGLETEVLNLQIDHIPEDYLSFLPYWGEVYPQLKALSPDSWRLGKFWFVRWSRKIEAYREKLLPYLLQNFLFSCLLDADKHITVLQETFPRARVNPNLVDCYRSLLGFDRPATFINHLRDDIYKEVMDHIQEVHLQNGQIFSLTAPTGSGKTLTAISFALRLREKMETQKGYSPRIIYALPFLSIIDQNADVFREVFKKVQGKSPTSDLLLVHHHLSDVTYTRQEDEHEPDEAEILIEGWDSEIVVTTFVQFFHTLFSNRNRAMRKFHRIPGSVIILDEIQSFPHEYWLLFQKTAEALAEYFNSYFLLSTATQPAIFESPIEVLTNKEKYFKNMDRVKLRFQIQRAQTISQLKDYLLARLQKESQDTLIVLNTISCAEKLYKMVKAPLREMGFEIFFLSSHVVPKERLRRIEQIKNSKELKVVISTQLVEAGVDLDFKWVIRDLGPMDSINQVAGRCNRNFGKERGLVELVLLEDENGRKFYSYIYDGLLISLTHEVLEGWKEVSEDALLGLIEEYFRRAKERGTDDRSRELLGAIQDLDYEQIGGFRLIEEPYGAKVDIFVEVDEEAHKVWEEFCAIRDITNRWKRRTAFKALRSKFYPYVISVQAEKALKNLPPEVCGIFYVPYNQMERWYDKDTGFKKDGETMVI